MTMPKMLALLAATLALAGCGLPTPTGDTSAPRSSTNDGRTTVAAFVSVNMDRVSERDFVENVSALYPHRCVVWLTNVKPGAAYQVTAELFDASGKSVLKKSSGIHPDSQAWAVAFDYLPPETPPKSGMWKWKVSASGIGDAEKKFEMLEPSKAEQADLARHQKAREAVLFGFANTWVYSEDFGVPCYFTSLLTGRLNAQGAPESFAILQVSGLSANFSHKHVTRADLFNGITYRGSAKFSFNVYRIWKDGEWSEWQDVERYGSSFEQALGGFANQMSRYIASNLPSGANNFLEGLQLGGYGLVYEVTERDGHWYVDSNSGAAWIDQRQSSPRYNMKNGAPRFGFIEDQKKKADSPRRKQLQQTEELLKNNKGGIPQDRPDMLKTMKSVKENSL
jgi:hypothetical protein